MDKEKIKELFLQLLEAYEYDEYQLDAEFGVGEDDTIAQEIIEWKKKINELLYI